MFTVGDHVQVFSKWGQMSRVAIGEVVEAGDEVVVVEFTTPRSISPCREKFGPHGGRNDDFRIVKYTPKDRAADEERARREEKANVLRGMLARIHLIAPRLSDKEQKALAAALKVFDPGVDDPDVRAAVAIEKWMNER